MAEIFDFNVNDNRTITFKLSEPIMLEDNGVSVWRFHIPNIVNGLNATGWQWWLVYVNARNDKYTIPLTLEYDYDRPDAYSIATYTVDYGMSCKVGNVKFSLEAIDADTGGTILHEWHTKTYSTNVIDTLQGNQIEYDETESDLISALLIEVRNRTNQLIGGATPTPVSAVSEMLDTDKLYLLTTDGEWYYYNGTAWVSGGVYGAGIVDSVPTQGSTNAVSSGGVYDALHDTDATLTQSGQAADAKAVGDKLAPLIGSDEQREITGWVYSKYINVANANIGDTVDITNVSSFYSLKYVVVDCDEGDKFLLNLAGAASARAWAFLTSNNVLISKADASVTLSNEEVIAPENAGKAIFQCIYRQSDTDTTTDNGKVYKIVQGTGNVVRFDIVQDKTEAQKAIARENIGITSSGEGLSEDAKVALLACFEHVAWVDEHGQDYYDALEEALYGITPSNRIAVAFDSRDRTFYTDDPISSIMPHLTVTYDGTVTTNYELTGSLSGDNVRVKIGDEYSRVIPITAESPKYEYSTANGSAELSIIDAGIDFSATPAPGLNWTVTTSTAIATRSGRKPYTNGNGWHMIPVPADCTSVTVSVQPSNVKYGMILYRFVPNSNTNAYISQVTEQTGTNTFTIAAQDLRTIALTANNYGTRATGCSVTFS